MQKQIIPILFVLLFLFSTVDAYGMTQCREYIDPIQKYPVIFKGKVTKIEEDQEIAKIDNALLDAAGIPLETGECDRDTACIWITMFLGDPKIAYFQVLETYKGVLPVDIRFRYRDSTRRGAHRNGGVSLRQKETYVVFASVSEAGDYMPSSCSAVINLPPSNESGINAKGIDWVRTLARIEGMKSEVNFLDELLEKHLDDPSFWYKKARYFHDLHDYQRAAHIYQEARKTFQDDTKIAEQFSRSYEDAQKLVIQQVNKRDIGNQDQNISSPEFLKKVKREAALLRGQAFDLLETSVLQSWSEEDADIRIVLTEKGQKQLQEITRRNMGKRILIYAGDILVSSPVVQDTIKGDKISLSVKGDKKEQVLTLLKNKVKQE